MVKKRIFDFLFFCAKGAPVKPNMFQVNIPGPKLQISGLRFQIPDLRFQISQCHSRSIAMCRSEDASSIFLHAYTNTVTWSVKRRLIVVAAAFVQL